MSAEKRLRLVLVGAGTRGRTWAGVLAETPEVELVGIVDRDESRARDAASGQSHQAAWDTDFASALDSHRPEAVIIATPPDSHHALVLQALSQGAHVLCEKPLSESIAEVVEMVARAKDRGLHLVVGMNFRYLSSSQRIRHYATTGELGALSHAQFSYIRHRDGNRADLNDYPMQMPYPLLLEQTIHHLDLLRYCYDTEVESLVAESWRPPWSSYEGDCCASILLRMENGARVNYLGTWTGSWNRMCFSWRSEFEAGALVQRRQFDDLVRIGFRPELARSGSRFKTSAEAEPTIAEQLEPCTPFVDDSRLLLREFMGAARGEVEPATTGRDHLKSLGLVQACIESIETGQWVDVARFYGTLGIPPEMLSTVTAS